MLTRVPGYGILSVVLGDALLSHSPIPRHPSLSLFLSPSLPVFHPLRNRSLTCSITHRHSATRTHSASSRPVRGPTAIRKPSAELRICSISSRIRVLVPLRRVLMDQGEDGVDESFVLVAHLDQWNRTAPPEAWLLPVSSLARSLARASACSYARPHEHHEPRVQSEDPRSPRTLCCIRSIASPVPMHDGNEALSPASSWITERTGWTSCHCRVTRPPSPLADFDDQARAAPDTLAHHICPPSFTPLLHAWLRCPPIGRPPAFPSSRRSRP
ncbi:hypothetical protein B0H12DRAFT_78499 [Mycena haematopus]|nr:hypothetical protein B0H12DRAFT_78499 [Mycena haematopus]